MSDLSMADESSPKRPQVTAHNQSRVRSYLRCRRQFYYRYDYPVLKMGARPGLELQPKRPALPLKRGSWMHKLMEAYWLELAQRPATYTIVRGKKTTEVEVEGWEGMHEVLTQEFDRLFDEEKEAYGDLPGDCERLFRGYLRRWKDDADKFRLASLHSGEPAVEFTIEVPLTEWGIEAPFKGTIDILVEDLEYGGLWIRDAKWVRNIPGPDERMMSPQNIIYVWAMRQLDYDVRGFIYDYGRTKAPTPPMILQSGMVTTRKNLDTDTYTYLQAIKQAHDDEWKLYLPYYKNKLKEVKARDVTWFDRERIPVEGPRFRNGVAEYIAAARGIERRGQAIRTYIRSCRWDCAYHEPCVAQFQGMDIRGLMKTQYELEPERYGLDEETSQG